MRHQRRALGQVVDRHGEEKKDSPLSGLLVTPALHEAQVNVRHDPVKEPYARAAQREARQDLRERAALDRRDEQAERRGREHDTCREPEQDVEKPLRRMPESKQPQAAEARASPCSNHPGSRGRVQRPLALLSLVPCAANLRSTCVIPPSGQKHRTDRCSRYRGVPHACCMYPASARCKPQDGHWLDRCDDRSGGVSPFAAAVGRCSLRAWPPCDAKVRRLARGAPATRARSRAARAPLSRSGVRAPG